MWHILFSIKIEKFYQNFPVFMGYTSNRSKCVCKQSIMWIIGYGWWWLFGRQKQVHIVCSNCSEEPISPLHRGINISSTSIGSQEVNIAKWQLWEVDQSHIRVQFLSLYTGGILGGCPESNSEVSECKEVSWEIPVVPIFYIHDFGWKARGAATGEICRAGTALLSTRWRQKTWQDILWVSSGDSSLSIHPSGTPERRAK